MPATTLSKSVRMIWGLSLHGWEDVMRGSLAIVGVFGLLVGLSTFFVVTLQRSEIEQSKEELDRYKVSVSKEISEANARAAEANRVAEGERLARTKLEEKIRPRSLSDEQKNAMVQILKSAPKGPVFVNPDWTNPEAKIFAAQISSALESAGYSLSRLMGGDAPLSYGKLGAFLVIRDAKRQPAHLKPLYDALNATGYDFVIYEELYVPEGAVLIGISAK